MVTAMMLPAALPFVAEFRRQSVGRESNAKLTLPLLVGYVGWWIPFGVLVYSMDLGIHRVSTLPILQGNLWLLGTSSLVIAGIYQFTSAKKGFARDCCFPGDLIRAHQPKNEDGPGAFKLGLSYGRADLGSHWALMLLMFALELGSILGMAVVGLAMAAEKSSTLSRTTRIVIGATLLCLAAFVSLVSLA